jgi:hypothetical protein
MSTLHQLGLCLLLTTPLVACGEPTEPLQEPQFAGARSFRATESFDFAVPIYLGCLDQEVVWSGTVQYDDHWVVFPDGSARVNGHASLHPGSTLVGASGTWTPVKLVNSYVQQFPADGSPGDSHVNERITWQNVATGQLMVVSLKSHFVIAGNGEVKRDEPFVHSCSLGG